MSIIDAIFDELNHHRYSKRHRAALAELLDCYRNAGRDVAPDGVAASRAIRAEQIADRLRRLAWNLEEGRLARLVWSSRTPDALRAEAHQWDAHAVEHWTGITSDLVSH